MGAHHHRRGSGLTLMPLVRVTSDLSINPACVASMSWDRAYSYTTFIITMVDGAQHRLRHEPYLMGGFDGYDAERRIIAATEEGSA